MEQKDIDRLFQEKLKGIEEFPHPRVWNAIEKKLQKKKRRVLPFWWFFGGIAALFIMGVFFNKTNKQSIESFPVITKEGFEKVVDDKGIIIKDTVDDKSIINREVEVVTKVEKQIIINNHLVSNSKRLTKINAFLKVSEEKLLKNKDLDIKVTSVAEEKKRPNNITNIDQNFLKITDLPKDITFLKESSNSVIRIAEKLNIQTKSEGFNKEPSSDVLVKKNTIKNNESLLKKGFIKKATKEDSFLINNDVKQNKWAIAPVVGVLKSNTFTQTSALDVSLNDNKFSGDNTVAYGVHVMYKLNKKWEVKSGVQLQKASFTTNRVALSSSTNNLVSSLENVFIDTDGSSTDLDVSIPSANFAVVDENGSLQQRYGYIEIPLEIKYTFFISSFIEASVVSGFSSLILNENSIVGSSDGVNTEIGKANNLNTVNFSGNFGFDIDLRLSNKINLNINPMFKTQLNTFSNNANGFKPYVIGVYTGLKYKF